MDSKYLVLLGLGFELVVLVVAFLYLGRYVDQHMGWPGFGIAGGAMLALVIWVIHLAVVMKAIDRDSPPENE